MTMMLTACSTGINFNPVAFFKGKQPKQVCQQYQALSYEDASTKMDIDIYQLQHNIERSLVFREEVAANLSKLNAYTKQDKPFSPALIDNLSQAIQKEIDLMRPILATVAQHGCWIKHEELKIDDHIKLKGNMIVLATLVSLYDEYGTVFAVISENDRLRRFLNNADSGYDRDEYLLESLTNMFIDSDLLSYTTDLIQEYSDGRAVVEKLAQDDENLALFSAGC